VKHLIGVIAVIIFILSFSDLSLAGTKDWRELKAEYQAKAHEEIDPINAQYKDALEEMLTKSRSSDGEQIAVIQELDALNDNPSLLLTTSHLTLADFEGEWSVEHEHEVWRLFFDGKGKVMFISPDKGTHKIFYCQQKMRYVAEAWGGGGPFSLGFDIVDGDLHVTSYIDPRIRRDESQAARDFGSGKRFGASSPDVTHEAVINIKLKYRERASEKIQRVNERYLQLISEVQKDISEYATAQELKDLEAEIKNQKNDMGNLLVCEVVQAPEIPRDLIGKWFVEWSNSKNETVEIKADGRVLLTSEESAKDESYQLSCNNLLEKYVFERGQAVIAVHIEDGKLMCMAWSKKQSPSLDKPMMVGVGENFYGSPIVECELAFVQFKEGQKLFTNRDYELTKVPDEYNSFLVSIAAGLSHKPLKFIVKKAGIITILAEHADHASGEGDDCADLKLDGWIDIAVVSRTPIRDDKWCVIMQKVLEKGTYEIPSKSFLGVRLLLPSNESLSEMGTKSENPNLEGASSTTNQSDLFGKDAV